jgi:glutathione-specific gamma-glutamylcyclotransferase
MRRHWVFGYGSLMWNPGFPFVTDDIAMLEGYHRSLCLFSHHYRGTAEKPGLVLALDKSGSCIGKAFAVETAAWDGVLAYLREREQISYVYLEKTVEVCLQETGELVQALTYVVDPNHSQYAGKLSIEETLRYVRQGVGLAGSCADYVKNTVAHLREIQVEDAYLEQVAAALE